MGKLTALLRRYRLFSLLLGVTLIALGLTILGQQTAANWVVGIVALAIALKLIWDLVQDLRAGTYAVDILAPGALILAVILGQFWASLILSLVIAGGQILENFGKRRARQELDETVKRLPRKATVVRKGKEQMVKASEIRSGDKIIIRSGETVPVDATVIEGSAEFDQSWASGDSLSLKKDVGDALLSGSINVRGQVTAQATADAEHSHYQQIIRQVRSSMGSGSPYGRSSERYVLPFSLAVYTLGAAMWVVGGQAVRFLDVIIVAAPSPLFLSVPIALLGGLAATSRHGIFVKNGTALERLAEARTFVLGGRGVLTASQPAVEKITALGDFKEDELLRLAASLEQNSSHPVARAIALYAASQNVRLVKAKHVKEVAGQGVEAHLQGKDILLGRLSFLEAYEVTAGRRFKPEAIKQTAAFLAVDGQLAGVIYMQAAIRPEAEPTIAALKQRGIKRLLLLTGNNARAAQQLAKTLSISAVHADTTPAEKLQLVEGIPEKDRPVVFVGDSTSDAPVLASADVGISLGAIDAPMAHEPAAITILPADVTRVATAHVIAKRTFRIATQGLLAGMTLTLLFIAIFATRKLPPVDGIVLRALVTGGVVFNALRAR